MAQLTTERFADLFCAIGNSSNVCGNLAHGRRILREPLICPIVSILSFSKYPGDCTHSSESQIRRQ
jgi:hypothetical protein